MTSRILRLTILALASFLAATLLPARAADVSLNTLRTQFATGMQSLGSRCEERKLAAAREYGESLDRLLKKMGDHRAPTLNVYRVEKEKKRFVDEKVVPAKDQEGVPAEVTPLVLAYYKAVAAADQDKALASEDLKKRYAEKLAFMAGELEKAGRKEDAERVRSERGELGVPDETTPALLKVPAGGKAPPADAKEFKGHHYKAFTEAMSWNDAFMRCGSKGGYLATISDAEENTFVAGLLGNEEGYWLGGFWSIQKWRWAGGQFMTYRNWDLKYPGKMRVLPMALFMRGGSNPGGWTAAAQKTMVPGYVCEWSY
jgi:hypothetical protein